MKKLTSLFLILFSCHLLADSQSTLYCETPERKLCIDFEGEDSIVYEGQSHEFIGFERLSMDLIDDYEIQSPHLEAPIFLQTAYDMKTLYILEEGERGKDEFTASHIMRTTGDGLKMTAVEVSNLTIPGTSTLIEKALLIDVKLFK